MAPKHVNLIRLTLGHEYREMPHFSRQLSRVLGLLNSPSVVISGQDSTQTSKPALGWVCWAWLKWRNEKAPGSTPAAWGRWGSPWRQPVRQYQVARGSWGEFPNLSDEGLISWVNKKVSLWGDTSCHTLWAARGEGKGSYDWIMMIIKDFKDDNANRETSSGGHEGTTSPFSSASGCPDSMSPSREALGWMLAPYLMREGWWETLGKCVNTAWTQIPCPSTLKSVQPDEEHDKLDGWLFSDPSQGHQDSGQSPLLIVSGQKKVLRKTWGECRAEHCSYSHLRQLHIRLHTHPISFSFDFESMKKVKRMLIFRKGEMVADNKLSPTSQCWQIAALPWFPIRNVESSPCMNSLSIIQRESLSLGLYKSSTFNAHWQGFLGSTEHLDSQDDQRPHLAFVYLEG